MGASLDKLSNVSTTNHLQDLSGFAVKEAIQTVNSRFLRVSVVFVVLLCVR
jgi:hypothetical protein